jgi:hypothetical protein
MAYAYGKRLCHRGLAPQTSSLCATRKGIRPVFRLRTGRWRVAAEERVAPTIATTGTLHVVALDALHLGRSGVSLMARISGLARSTIHRGLSHLHDKASAPLRRIRKEGGGLHDLTSRQSLYTKMNCLTCLWTGP